MNRLSEEALQSQISILEDKLNQSKQKALDCVTKVRHGLGAGGNGSGMYAEISVGNVVLDSVADEIEESFQ